jgi:alkanesulfonate monooxygenase SsuD/methylene tetrahydromethanopterin reductase-like flavin-dependent oxidoreductase (luciferase family)
MVERIAELGFDHGCAGDHVSFHTGAGRDALIDAAAMLSMHPALPVYVGLYLLPLRHPVPVARQLATLAELAPGRLTLGVGIGGEDPHELEICGVDPRSRGRRMNECLPIVRALLGGEPVSFAGDFFSIDHALILPAPDPPIRFSVGGRSGAAVRRASEHGEGWLAIWVSARRFAAAVSEIAERAESTGRSGVRWEHALNLWCGLDASAAAARRHLAEAMSDFYRLPFESFERYCPHGTPEQVVEFLAPYVEAGCSTFNLLPCAASPEAALEGAAEVRRLLRAAVPSGSSPVSGRYRPASSVVSP